MKGWCNKLEQQKLEMLSTLFPDEVERIKDDKCPLCAQPIRMKDFRDPISLREYEISGMCQDCQDTTFEEDPEEIPFSDVDEYDISGDDN